MEFHPSNIPASAIVLRDAFLRLRVDELGGQPLEGSGFENESPEPDFYESE